jgi:hypothetical protein
MLPSTPLTGSQVVLLGWSAYIHPAGIPYRWFGISLPNLVRLDTTMSTFENINVVEKIDEIDMMSPL